MHELFIESDSYEIRTALRRGAAIVELNRESCEQPVLVGAIFHARVRRVMPAMGSAFLNIGLDRDAFLQLEDLGGRGENIDDLIAVGDRMLVQVVRDRPGKGPRVTTRLALAGRCLVLLPTADGVAVSRKIDDPEEVRKRLEPLLSGDEFLASGWIVRTAGEKADRDHVEAEARELLTRWGEITKEYRESKHAHLLYAEPDLAARSLRDTAELDRVVVQGPVSDRVVDHARRWAIGNVEVDAGSAPLFARVGLDEEIARLQKPWVSLTSGGSLVIESTEALVSVDVNSGSDVGEGDFEQLALETNLEAAAELARQIRARGIGGLVVIDFIDMRRAESRENLLDALREAVSEDPHGVRVGGMSRFGLVDLTRRHPGTSYFEQSQRSCPTCGGRGKVASIRSLRSSIRHHLATIQDPSAVELHVAPETAERLGDLSGLSSASTATPKVIEDPHLSPSELAWRKI